MKQLQFGHYLVVNDAELCELDWEVVVVLLGCFCRSGWFQGSVRGFVGLLWCLVLIKPQMNVCCKHRYVDLAFLYAFNVKKILISLDYQLE